MRNTSYVVLLHLVFAVLLGICRQPPEAVPSIGGQAHQDTSRSDTASPLDKAVRHLVEEVDAGLSLYVYKDIAWPGNMDYAPTGWMGDVDHLAMDESFAGHGIEGTCIKIDYSGPAWAGIYWQRPAGNWGKDTRRLGRDLSGARTLSFRGKSLRGNTRIKVGLGGIDGPSGDSAREVPRYLIFSDRWQEHVIDLTGCDLSHIIGAFMVAFESRASILLDDIRFDFVRSASTPRFVRSFTLSQPNGQHPVNLCAAHLYDNALAVIALACVTRNSAAGTDAAGVAASRLRSIADAMVLALEHDRAYSDGRLRNVYAGFADLMDAHGNVRLNGWYDTGEKRWLEDHYGASTTTGNLAWTVLALIEAWRAVEEPVGQRRYLDAALRVAEWIDTHTRADDAEGGYTGGYEGWEKTPQNPRGPQKLLWRATEHNLDIIACGDRLHRITGNARWARMADHARRFVNGMFDETEGHFWTGRLPDGAVNRTVVPLDCQTWAALTLGDTPETRRAMAWTLRNLVITVTFEGEPLAGTSFGTAAKGIWPEGLAQWALACRVTGLDQETDAALVGLNRIQAHHPRGNGGGMVASVDESHATGFGDNRYFAVPHLGATAWFIFAHLNHNPMGAHIKGDRQ